MRDRGSSSSSSYIGPRERRSGSHESNSGEERPHSRDSCSRSESSSSGSESARPSVAATAASTTVPEHFITEFLAGQQEPVAFIGACPLHSAPFPSVIESLQQCIARGAAAAAAAAVAAHRPAARATKHAAAATTSASEYDSGFFEREDGPQADEQDPTHEVYVQEVWCSSLCGDDGLSWQQRLQQQFLRFLSDSAALRASARVLLLMRPDLWFERVVAPHTSSRGTWAAAGEAGKQKKRGATAAADDNAAAIAALCEAGLQAGAATGDSDSSRECDAEEAETGAADTESPTSAVRGAAGSTEHGNTFPASPLFSRRKQRHPRGRRNASGETEFVVRMLQWLQEALKLQQQLWGVRRRRHPETAAVASGEAGERGVAQCMRGPAGLALAVGVFEHQLPRRSPYHKVFESWLLLPPPRCSFFPTEREFGHLASCQQEAVMKLQGLMQREPQQLRDAAVGAFMAFADSRFSWEEEEELLAIVEDHEQQQQQARGQLQQRQEQQLQQPEYQAASVVQQTHRGVLSQSKKWKRWHEAANPLRWPTSHGEHAMLQREQQLLQEEDKEEEDNEEEEESEPSVNREVFFPDHASVMLLPEEEQLIDMWKLLACGGHGRKDSRVLQSDRCAAEDSRLTLCSRRAAASARRAGAGQTAAASDLAAPPAGHAEPAAAAGRELRAAPKKEEDASAAVAAADASAVSPSAEALCMGFRTASEGHVGPAAGELPTAEGTGDIEGRSSRNNAAVGTGDIEGRSSSSNNSSARDDAVVAGAAAEAVPAAPAFTGLAPQPTAKSRAGRVCPALRPPGSPRLLCAPPFVVPLLLQQQQQQRQPCPRLLLPSFQGMRLQCGGGSSAPLSDAFPPLLLRCACCRCAARRGVTSSRYRRIPRDRRKTSSGGDVDEVDHRACGGRSSDYGAEGDEAESCCHLRDACCCCYCRDDLGSSAATSGEGFRSSGDGERRTGESRWRRRKRCTRCAAGRRAGDSAVGHRLCESSMRSERVDSRGSSTREGRSGRKASSRQKRGGSKAARERRGGVVSDCRCFCLYRRETLWRGLKAGEGRSFLICGPLGSGKSVLLRTLASALSSSSSDSWWSGSHDTENVATSSWRLRKKTCGISNHNASDDMLYGTGASCNSEGNSSRMKQRDSGCSGQPSGSGRCDERDEGPQNSRRQRGGVVFAHVGQLLHGEVGASHRAFVQLFSSAAAADAAICLECIDVAFGSAAGVGRQKELWIDDDVGGGSQGCRTRGSWSEREEDEMQGRRCGHGGAREKKTPPTHGDESLGDDYAGDFEEGREELFEDDDELPGHLDDPVAELQAELMQLFETLVDVFVRQGGVTLFCTVSTRPEFLPLQLLRCFSDTIRLSPMLSDSPEL